MFVHTERNRHSNSMNMLSWNVRALFWFAEAKVPVRCAYRRLHRVFNLSAAISINNFPADLIGERRDGVVRRQQLFWVCAPESAEVDKCGARGSTFFHISQHRFMFPASWCCCRWCRRRRARACSLHCFCLICTPPPDRSVAIESARKEKSNSDNSIPALDFFFLIWDI